MCLALSLERYTIMSASEKRKVANLRLCLEMLPPSIVINSWNAELLGKVEVQVNQVNGHPNLNALKV